MHPQTTGCYVMYVLGKTVTATDYHDGSIAGLIHSWVEEASKACILVAKSMHEESNVGSRYILGNFMNEQPPSAPGRPLVWLGANKAIPVTKRPDCWVGLSCHSWWLVAAGGGCWWLACSSSYLQGTQERGGAEALRLLCHVCTPYGVGTASGRQCVPRERERP